MSWCWFSLRLGNRPQRRLLDSSGYCYGTLGFDCWLQLTSGLCFCLCYYTLTFLKLRLEELFLHEKETWFLAVVEICDFLCHFFQVFFTEAKVDVCFDVWRVYLFQAILHHCVDQLVKHVTIVLMKRIVFVTTNTGWVFSVRFSEGKELYELNFRFIWGPEVPASGSNILLSWQKRSAVSTELTNMLVQ